MKKIYSLFIFAPILFYSQNKKIEIDPTFAVNGIYTEVTAKDNDDAISKVLPDGKILFYRSDNAVMGQSGEIISRFLSNGQIDVTFGNNGSVRTSDIFQSTNSTYILFANDGSIYLSIYLPDNNNSLIAKLTPNGLIDTGFATNGKLTIPGAVIQGNDYYSENKSQLSNGNILFGYIKPSDADKYNFICLSNNGTIVTDFGTNGILSFNKKSISNVRAVENKFYVTTEEYVPPTANIVQTKRYNNDASLDSSFQPINFYEEFEGTSHIIHPDNENNVYTITNYFNENTTVISSEIKKYNSNGILISNFGNSGTITNSNFGFINIIFDNNDNPLFSGTKSYGSELFNPLMVKYTKDGTLDTTFNQTGIYEELNSSLAYFTHLSYTPLAANQIITSGVSDNQYSKFISKYKLTDVLSTNENTLSPLTIYPNPVRDKFTIQNSSKQKIQSVKVFSTDGKLLLQSNSEKNNIEKLSQGLYIVEIKTDTNLYKKKIIKK